MVFAGARTLEGQDIILDVKLLNSNGSNLQERAIEVLEGKVKPCLVQWANAPQRVVWVAGRRGDEIKLLDLVTLVDSLPNWTADWRNGRWELIGSNPVSTAVVVLILGDKSDGAVVEVWRYAAGRFAGLLKFSGFTSGAGGCEFPGAVSLNDGQGKVIGQYAFEWR